MIGARATAWCNLLARACAGFALAWLLAACATAHAAGPTTQVLDSGWQFRIAPGDAHAAAHPDVAQWMPASVPGAVQTDLLAQHRVPDPYWRDNEPAIQWVGLSNWIYRTHFNVDAGTLARSHADLVFDGLDTFADVYLNGHRILAADNMFRRWRVPVKPLLHAGANTLEVRLYSPIARLQPWLLKQPYALPGEFDSVFGDEPAGKQTANYVRKAAYQYGWDWGPRIVTEGIWQPVRLESWNTLRLVDFHIAQQHVDAHLAQLQAQLQIDADQVRSAQVALRWSAPDGTARTLTQNVSLKAGSNTVAIPVEIADPQRWWPVGYGKPNLYDFHAAVTVAGEVVASAERETGLRSVELRRPRDQWGRGFEFVVNGVPIFAKGANFIPMDMFPARVTPARIDQLLRSARDANMNMLRVWGGGYYLPDDFYATADKLGLMVWQDFMFGGAIPPGDKAFRDNTRASAIQQVRRLRDHPSIVLWCGNNEVETGWESWDDREAFKKTLTATQRAQIEQGMRELFDHTLRDVVAQDAPGDALPASAYLGITPRFMSEYGLQSAPVMATIDSFTDAPDRTLDSRVMRAHQKFDRGKQYAESRGNQRLLKYVEREFGAPKDFAALVYLSQVMQADGIQLAAEHLRASRPRSMGSLFWQLGDVWPGITWSSIDYDGRWKALQFHARRFYAPLLVAALRDHGVTRVSLVSDRAAPVAASWRVRVMDFAGKLLSDHTADVTLPPLSAQRVAQFDDAALLHGADPRRTFAVFDLRVAGQRVSRNLVFFAAPKALALPVPRVATQWAPAPGGYTLTLTSTQLARAVWVSFGQLDATLSDNAFNILPGRKVVLTVHSGTSLDALRGALRVQNLAAAMAGAKP